MKQDLANFLFDFIRLYLAFWGGVLVERYLR